MHKVVYDKLEKMSNFFLVPLLIWVCYSQENKMLMLPDFELKIIRTFHNPVIFKYDSNTDELIGMVYSGAGGYDWGKLSYENRKKLILKEINEIKGIVNSLEISSLMENDNIIGLDGSSWNLILGKDTLISKWTPTCETKKRNLQPLVTLGKYLWEIIGIKEDIKEIY